MICADLLAYCTWMLNVCGVSGLILTEYRKEHSGPQGRITKCWMVCFACPCDPIVGTGRSELYGWGGCHSFIQRLLIHVLSRFCNEENRIWWYMNICLQVMTDAPTYHQTLYLGHKIAAAPLSRPIALLLFQQIKTFLRSSKLRTTMLQLLLHHAALFFFSKMASNEL